MFNQAVLTRTGQRTEQVSLTGHEGGGWAADDMDVVEYVGDRVILDHEHMVANRLYTLRFGGRNCVAVKRQDGSVDVFRVP